MDNSFNQKETGAQQMRGFLVVLRIFESILLFIRRSVNWLARLVKLTEKEREDAGLFLGYLGDK